MIFIVFLSLKIFLFLAAYYGRSRRVAYLVSKVYSSLAHAVKKAVKIVRTLIMEGVSCGVYKQKVYTLLAHIALKKAVKIV